MRLFANCLNRVAAAFALLTGLGLLPASAEGVGVIMLHARGSFPSQFEAITPKLEKAGFGMLAPEMCWSIKRLYDGTVDSCMSEIDKAVNELKGKGFDRIVLAGNDLGGMGALYYASKHANLAGIIAWGATRGMRANSQDDVSDALAQVKMGNGDKKTSFGNGRTLSTPNALLSFEGNDSVLAETNFFSKVSVPVLWMAANDDLGPRDPRPDFSRFPKNTLNTLTFSTSDHFSMVDVSIGETLDWLNKLKAAK